MRIAMCGCCKSTRGCFRNQLFWRAAMLGLGQRLGCHIFRLPLDQGLKHPHDASVESLIVLLVVSTRATARNLSTGTLAAGDAPSPLERRRSSAGVARLWYNIVI